MVRDAVEALSGIDILVKYAAHQMTFKALADMLDTEAEKTFATNIHPVFYLAERPLPTWGMARRSSTPHQSTPIALIPRCSPMRPSRRDTELHRGSRAAFGREGNSGVLCGAGSGLNPINTGDHAARRRRLLRQRLSDKLRGAA